MNQNIYKSLALWIAKICLFIIPLIPLYVAKDLFFPYITGKAFIFRVLIEIAFAAWVFLAIYFPEYRPKKSALSLAVLGFIAVVSLATIFGVNPERAFWSNFERMEGLVAYIHLVMYFFVLAHVFKKTDWVVFLSVFAFAIFYENIYAFFQKLGRIPSPQGGGRVDGTVGNPAYLAAYLIFGAAFCLWLYWNAKNKLLKGIYAFVGAWALLSIYFTATRGAVLGILGGAFLAVILYLFLNRGEAASKGRKVALVVLAFLVVVPLSLWLMRGLPIIKNNMILGRLTSLSFTEQTITSRFTIWSMSMRAVPEYPVLGWGPEGYIVVFPKYYKPELWKQEPWFDRSHNIVFDWLINAGILGLVAYFSMFFSALWLLWRAYKLGKLALNELILWVSLLAAYLFQNLFVFDQMATYLSYFALLAYIQSLFVDEKPADEKKLAGKDKKPALNISETGAIMAVIVLIPLALTVYFINGKPYLANRSLLEALKYQNQPENAFKNYEAALSYSYLGRQEIREQFARFAINAGASAQVSADLKDKMLRRAIDEAQKGVEENKFDPRAYLFLGSILNRVGATDVAIKVFEEAIQLSPYKQQIYFELADTYIKRNDYPNAIATLQKSFDFDREFDSARINLASAYVVSGQQDKADALLMERYGTVDVADDVLAQSYGIVKNYDRLIRVRQAFLKRDPNNAGYHAGLAGAYSMAGMKTEAIHELEETARLDPASAAQVQAYIQQLQSK